MSATFVFAAISIGVLVTSFISGILGMAGGMILMGLLLAVLPVASAMMLHGITQMASNGWRAWLWRTHVNWRVFFGYAFGAMLALSSFLLIQIVVTKPVAYLLLGTTPFIGYLLPERLALNVDKAHDPFICGLVCTGMQLLAGVSGPLLDVFFVRSQMDRRAVVATKAMSQTLGHFIKIIFFGSISYRAVGDASVGLSPALMVACVAIAFIGTSLSKRVLEKISDANFRQWTQWTVLTIGVVYLSWGSWLLIAKNS